MLGDIRRNKPESYRKNECASVFRPGIRYREWGVNVMMVHAVQVVDADFAKSVHRACRVTLLYSYASELVGGGRPLEPDVRERLIPALAKFPTTLVMLAVAGEEVVGVAICFEGFSTFSARSLLNIHDLAVLPAWRGKGVGRALLEAVEERAGRRGCCKLTLEVTDANPRARQLYQRVGFRDYELGDSSTTHFMTKPL